MLVTVRNLKGPGVIVEAAKIDAKKQPDARAPLLSSAGIIKVQLPPAVRVESNGASSPQQRAITAQKEMDLKALQREYVSNKFGDPRINATDVLDRVLALAPDVGQPALDLLTMMTSESLEREIQGLEWDTAKMKPHEAHKFLDGDARIRSIAYYPQDAIITHTEIERAAAYVLAHGSDAQREAVHDVLFRAAFAEASLADYACRLVGVARGPWTPTERVQMVMEAGSAKCDVEQLNAIVTKAASAAFTHHDGWLAMRMLNQVERHFVAARTAIRANKGGSEGYGTDTYNQQLREGEPRFEEIYGLTCASESIRDLATRNGLTQYVKAYEAQASVNSTAALKAVSDILGLLKEANRQALDATSETVVELEGAMARVCAKATEGFAAELDGFTKAIGADSILALGGPYYVDTAIAKLKWLASVDSASSSNVNEAIARFDAAVKASEDTSVAQWKGYVADRAVAEPTLAAYVATVEGLTDNAEVLSRFYPERTVEIALDRLSAWADFVGRLDKVDSKTPAALLSARWAYGDVLKNNGKDFTAADKARAEDIRERLGLPFRG